MPNLNEGSVEEFSIINHCKAPWSDFTACSRVSLDLIRPHLF